MTDFSTLYQEVQGSIGRDDVNDSLAIQIAKRGLNIATFAATLLFKPSEAKAIGTLTATTTQEYVATTTLTRLQEIEDVYNSTSGDRVWPLPFESRRALWLPTTGDVLFWSLYGTRMYYNPTPDVNNTLDVYFLQYPTTMSSGSDVFLYPTLEGYVLTFATEYAWACLEETESAAIWNRLIEKVTLPELVAAKLRMQFQEEVTK